MINFTDNIEDWKKAFIKATKISPEDFESVYFQTLQHNLTVPSYLSLTKESNNNSITNYQSDKLSHQKPNDWISNYTIETDESVTVSNEKALRALSKEVESITFLGEDIIHDLEIEKLLENIETAYINLYFDCGENNDALYFLLLDFATAQNKKINGAILNDPLTNYAFRGYQTPTFEEQIKLLNNQIQNQSFNFKALTIHSGKYAEAGCTVVQELAYILALGVAYISPLLEKNSLEEINNTILIKTHLSTNYFLEIAKLRAIRILWNSLLQQFKAKSDDYTSTIYAGELKFQIAVQDIENNMIRSTIKAMAGVLGGADVISLENFDCKIVTEGSDLSETTNIHLHHLLKHESFFNQFADPSDGSYYTEHLTKDLCEKAWQHFQNIEQQGGFIETLENGFIQNEIEAEATILGKKFKDKSTTLVGVNLFPNNKKYSKRKTANTLFIDKYREKTIKPLQLFTYE